MLSYPYILATAEAILAHSEAIKGRVFMAPFYASELNSPNLEQIIADTLNGTMKKVYPLSLILPPVSDGDFMTTAGNGWENYTINQLFLVQEGRTSSGQMKGGDLLTNNSKHTIIQDWHDMRRCATSYMKTLFAASVETDLRKTIRLSQQTPQRIVTITRMANDKVNGVMITYRMAVYEGCAVEDYPGNVVDLITLPNGDQHPEHTL